MSALSRKNRLVIGGAIAIVLIGYLIWSSFAGAAQKNISIKELTANPESYMNQGVRITGKVVPGSIEKGGEILRFQVVEDGATIYVEYEGTMPNSFQDNADVIADGELKDENTFYAKSLLVKCPSKYTAGDSDAEK